MKDNLAIFDLDGTLFDTNNVNYYAYCEAMKQYGMELEYEYYINECNGRHYKEFLSRFTNDILVVELIHNTKKTLYSKYLQKARPNIHLFEVLNLLKNNYYTALVTTASKKNCFEILNYFNKVDVFDLILTHEDVTYVKPHPEGFIKAMEFFNTDAKKTIIFEDSNIGLEAARKLSTTIFKIEHF